MSTIREQIIAQIVTQLGTMSPTTPIYRSRVTALQRSESPAIVVEPVEDIADPTPVGAVQWALQLRVAVIVRGATPDSLADPVINGLHAKMMTDKSLGGLSMDIEATSVKFELLNGDQPVGVISCGYRVDYRTKFNDLSHTA